MGEESRGQSLTLSLRISEALRIGRCDGPRRYGRRCNDRHRRSSSTHNRWRSY